MMRVSLRNNEEYVKTYIKNSKSFNFACNNKIFQIREKENTMSNNTTSIPVLIYTLHLGCFLMLSST